MSTLMGEVSTFFIGTPPWLRGLTLLNAEKQGRDKEQHTRGEEVRDRLTARSAPQEHTCSREEHIHEQTREEECTACHKAAPAPYPEEEREQCDTCSLQSDRQNRKCDVKAEGDERDSVAAPVACEKRVYQRSSRRYEREEHQSSESCPDMTREPV